MSSPASETLAMFEVVVKKLNGFFALLACGLVVVVMAVVVVAIVAREIGLPLLWATDIAQIAFVYMAFLSFGPALASGHHVTVELFEPLVPRPLRRYLDAVAALACALFGAIFLYELWSLAGRSFADGRMAVTVIPIQLKWIQLAGLIGVAQFCLTALLQFALAVAAPGRRQGNLSAGH